MLKAVPASDALFSSGSPLPKTTAELSLVDLALVRKAKHLSDGHGVLDVGEVGLLEGGLVAATVPPGVTKDSEDVIKNDPVYDAARILVAARKSKLVCNEIDRCMKAEQRLQDAKTKHVHLMNHIRQTRNEQARKSVAYRHDAKVSDIKART